MRVWVTWLCGWAEVGRCMQQDCVQSIDSIDAQSIGNAKSCRFLDSLGLCFTYKEAQVSPPPLRTRRRRRKARPEACP